MCNLIFTLLLSVVSQPLLGQWMPDRLSEELIQRGIEQTYNIEFDSAAASFQRVIDMHPKHPAGHFFVAMIDWMNILVDLDDDSQDDIFFDQLEHVIRLSDDILKKDPQNLSALFFKGGAIGFRGRLRAHRGQWVRAANDGRRALPIVRQTSVLAPDNADILLGSGIYNYYAAVVPEQYPLVRPLMIFFPSGNKEEGLHQLRIAAQNGQYAGVESAYFLMQILYFNEKEYREGYYLARELHNRFPNNPLFHRYYGRFSVSIGQWEEAYRVFNEVIDRYERGMFGYSIPAVREAKYYVGQYRFNHRMYEDALLSFNDVLSYSHKIDEKPQSGFEVLATLRIGMIYDILQKRDHALQYYRTVKSMHDYQNSRSLADRYMRTPYSRGTSLPFTIPD